MTSYRNLTGQPLLLAILFAMPCISGCEQNGHAPPGQVALQFDSMSESDVTFTVHNGLDRPIKFKGRRTLDMSLRSLPGTTNVECSFGAGERPKGELYTVIIDGDSKPFDVSPGKAITLVVPTQLPQQYLGGTCAIRFLIEGAPPGKFEFRPR